MTFEEKLREEHKAGKEEGLKEGREEGKEEVRSALGRLFAEMKKDGRTAEFLEALESGQDLDALLEEYGL